MKKISAHIFNIYSSGFTMLELLIVIAILGIIVFPILLTWGSSRANQALVASADNFANNVKTVHIYAREARDSKAWGIVGTSDSSYQLVSGSASSPNVATSQILESQIKFTNPGFSVWFGIGTGEIGSDQSVEMVNLNGKKIKVNINKNGLVETSGVY